MKKLIIILISTFICTDFAWGMKWVRNSDLGESASIRLSTTFTDNSELGSSTESDTGANSQVRPSIGVKGYSRYINVDVNYSVAVSLDGNNGAGSSRLQHFLNANADIEAWEDVLFVDIAANSGVTTIDSTLAAPSTIEGDSTNTTQTYSLKISPRMVHHFGNYADSVISLSADSLQNSSSLANDSDNMSINYSLTSGRHFNRLGWGVTATQSKLSNQGGEDDDALILNTNLDYKINRSWSSNLSLGYEDRDFQTTEYTDTEGLTWNISGSWKPNSRISAQLGYGEQFFGNSWNMNLSYKHRKSVITASYNTSLTTSRQEQLETIITPFLDIEGNPVFIGDEQLFVVGTLPTLSDENIVQEQFRLAYQLSGKKTSFNLSTTMNKRDFQKSGDQTTTTSMNMSLSRKLNPSASITTGWSWLLREDNTASTEQETQTFRLGFGTKVGRKSTINLDYQYTDNQDDADTNDYTENRLTASVGLTF